MLLVALTLVPFATNAQTMTTIVADGSATNDYVPIYGYWADAAQHNQIVYSSDLLADIPGVTISGMKFYATSSPSWGNTATISLAIVDSPTLSGLNSTATLTQVYSGSVSFSNNEWSITFATPFTYTSGNLLVDIVTTAGSYSSCDFYGISTSYSASYYSYNGSGSNQSFIPKTQFTHTIPVLSCYRPTDVVVSNITSSGATLNWSDTMNSGATYSIDYWKNGGDTNTVTTSTTTYTFTGLDANSLYRFAVKSICSATDESFATTGNFVTLCGSSTCEMSVTATAQYASWGSSYTPSATIMQNGIEIATVQGTQQVNVCSSDTVVVIYVAPMYTYGSTSVTVVDGGGTTIYDGTTSSNNTGDILATIATPCPTCIPPMDLVAVADSNEIAFSWTPRSGATQFAVYLNDSLVSDAVYDTSYIFTSLPANTPYTIGVQGICSASDSSSIATINTRTLCGIVGVPYTTGFEGLSTGNLPDCWTAIQTGTSGSGTFPSVYNYSSNALNGNVYFELESNSGETEVVALPMMDDISNLMLTFYASVMSSSVVLEVGVMEGSTFVTVDTVALTVGSGNNWHGSYNEYDVPFTNYAGDGNRIALRVSAPGSYTLMMDDFSVTVNSGCERPTTVVVDSVGPYDAYLRWDAVDGVSSYNVYYGTVNDPTDANVQSTSFSDTTGNLTGLLPQTTYYAWVTSDCGSAESDFRTAGSFTTQLTCAPVTGATMGNISYTAAQITWAYDTTIGFPSNGAHLVLTDNTDTSATPEEYDVTDDNYTFTNLMPGHSYTVVLRNICTTPDQVDTASAVNVNFMTTSCAEIISDGTTPNNYIPTYTYYNYSYAQAIYTRMQMPNIDTIHGIAFNNTTAPATNNVRTLDVYMGHTSQSTFSGSTAWVSVDSMTLVASNVSLDASTTGWHVISFDSAFVYNGHSNVVIAIDDNTGSYKSGPQWASLSANSQGLYKYNDPTNYSPSDPPSGTVINKVPAVRFVADCEVPQCFAPMLTLDSVDAENISITWVSTGTESSWVVGIKPYGATNYTYEAAPVTDTFFTFTNLSGSTLYDIIVGSLCDGGDTLFATIQATTPCAGNTCDITVNMTDGYGDGWNGNSVEVYQNGALAGSATITSGNSGSETIAVCSNIPTEFRLHKGSYPDEIGFTILDGGDAEIYTAAVGTFSSSTADGLVLDSIANPCPSCFTPDSLVVTLIDSTELEFAWRYIDSVYSYLVSFNGGPWEIPSINTYNAFNLDPNTSYTFSVMAICQPGDTSNARTITVKTACSQMVLPYVEGFENDNIGDVPSCWTVVAPGTADFPAISATANTGSQALTMTGNSIIASSAVPLNGDSIYVSFWAAVDASLEAGVMTNLADDSTFIPIITATGDDYTRYEFNTSSLSAYYDSTFYVAFRFNGTGSGYYMDYANIDDINIRLNEGCMYPANVVATPGAHNLNLTWSNSSSTASFAVQYRETGTTAWDTNGYNTFDTTFNITGLDAATMYEVRVGFICNNDTLWTTISTQTTCDLLTLPYTENFEAYANDVMPPCWNWNMSFATHWDGGVFLKAYHGGGSEYVVVPQLVGNITKMQIEFDCKVGTISEQDGILFGVTDAAGTLIAWLDTIQDVNHSRNQHVHHILNMLNYSVPGGAARFAFAQLRNWGEWALIDNINIDEMPDCYPVDSLAIHNEIDPDHTNFTWASLGEEIEWQVYVDTVTAIIDSIPDSLFTIVSSRFYEIPVGTIQGGGIYTFYVRSYCSSAEQSNWNSVTFGAGTYVMNNSSTADTVVACGLVVYDNGGPIAGYLPNSNSALVIRSENAGSELQLFGAAFGIGSSGATLTVYDGEGTSGSVLYTYNTTDGRDTILDTNLATTTTGAMTITFVANGSMCHTGYELYIHCVGTAVCERPTQLNAVMTEVGEAMVTWHGSSAAYDLYYKPTGATNWTIQNTTADSLQLTGLLPDTTYDIQVVGICGTDTSIASFPIVLNTHYTVVISPCDPISGLTVSDVTNSSAVLSWTSNGGAWEIEVTRVGLVDTILANINPYTLTGLLPNMAYSVRMRTACSGVHVDPYSDWSAAETFTTPLDGPQTYTLTVVANNDAWGTVTGSGTYTEGTEVTLTAAANDGYYFDRWSDGDTNDTRVVTVTANATYTANFAENGTHNTYYTVTVTSNNDEWGTVTGSGEYIEGSTAIITATANSGYHFVEWNDGNTDTVRTIVVIEHITYVATFAPNTGIDDVSTYSMSLYPNPASSTVTVSIVGFEGQAKVELVDVSGRCVATQWTTDSRVSINVSELAQGAYFVRVTGEKATAVSRLIVK